MLRIEESLYKEAKEEGAGERERKSDDSRPRECETNRKHRKLEIGTGKGECNEKSIEIVNLAHFLCLLLCRPFTMDVLYERKTT